MIVRHAILQLLMDWSFIFGDNELGKRSKSLFREISIRKGITIRPSNLAAEFYEQRSLRTQGQFVKGFEFEYRADQIIAHKDKSKFSILESLTNE